MRTPSPRSSTRSCQDRQAYQDEDSADAPRGPLHSAVSIPPTASTPARSTRHRAGDPDSSVSWNVPVTDPVCRTDNFFDRGADQTSGDAAAVGQSLIASMLKQLELLQGGPAWPGAFQECPPSPRASPMIRSVAAGCGRTLSGCLGNFLSVRLGSSSKGARGLHAIKSCRVPLPPPRSAPQVAASKGAVR